LPDSASPKRILIVRLSAIGDTIHSLPLAAALRREYPGCFLGWVTESPSAPLLADNPLIDWLHVLPKGWLKSPRLILELRNCLLAERFDTAFDIQGLSKSAIAAKLSGAGIRIGFVRGEGREIAPLLDNRLVIPAGRHAVEITLSLLAGLGVIPPVKPEFVLPPCRPQDALSIDNTLKDRKYSGGYVLLGPWGSLAAKLWPLSRFRELARGIAARADLPSLALGYGEKERQAVAAAAVQSEGTLALAPEVNAAGVVELARRARLFVGCDSFPLHAASATGCPSLGLFGVTDPLRLGPLAANSESIFGKLTLPKSTRERRRLGQENMLALDVGKVLERCLYILARTAR
jgi:ADP-heptose:LPS heptosyltransferase